MSQNPGFGRQTRSKSRPQRSSDSPNESVAKDRNSGITVTRASSKPPKQVSVSNMKSNSPEHSYQMSVASMVDEPDPLISLNGRSDQLVAKILNEAKQKRRKTHGNHSKDFGTAQRLRLNSMRTANEMTDIVIKCGSKTFHCHQVILAASSVYFETMFRQKDMAEVKTKEVKLEILSPATVSLLLDYMYMSEIIMTWKNMKDVLFASDYLQMETLKDYGMNFILSFLHPRTAMYIYQVSKVCNLSMVEEKAWDMLNDQFFKYVTYNSFVNLSLEPVAKLASSPDLKIRNEDPVLRTALIWTKHEPVLRREQFLTTLFPLVRLTFCTSGYLCSLIEEEELLASVECQASLARALARAVEPANNVRCLQKDSFMPRTHFAKKATTLFCYGGYGDEEEGKHAFKKMWALEELEDSDSPGNSDKARWRTVEDFRPELSIPDHKEDEYYQEQYSVCAIPNGFFLSGGRQVEEDSDEDDSIKASSKAAMFLIEGRQWKNLPNIPYRRWKHSCVYLNGKVYNLGGGCEKVLKKWGLVFSIHNRKWSVLNDHLQECVAYPTVFAKHSNIYTFGGKLNNGSFSSKVHIYNTGLFLFQKGADMPQCPKFASAVSVKEQIFVVGGYRDPVCMSYNPVTDHWVTLAAPFFHHGHGAAIMYRGRILLAGGEYNVGSCHAKGFVDAMETYDPDKNEWSGELLPVTKLPLQVSHICFTYGVFDIRHSGGAK